MKRKIEVVVGINKVDTFVQHGWNDEFNSPLNTTVQEIERRRKDILRKLCLPGIKPEQVIAYSALRKYNLQELQMAMMRFSERGFLISESLPRNPIDDLPEDVREVVWKVLAERQARGETRSFDGVIGKFFGKHGPDMARKAKAKLDEQRAIPFRLAIFGQTGVGKTTTINSLFRQNLPVGRVGVGTTEAAVIPIREDGLCVDIVDLPGYGRSIAEDRKYHEIYARELPKCDCIFLVIQADEKAMVDDQEMLLSLDSIRHD